MTAHYGRHTCRSCGRSITNNALGRAAHERSAACAEAYARLEARKASRIPASSAAGASCRKCGRNISRDDRDAWAERCPADPSASHRE